MTQGAPTPEELEILFEDAVVLRDRDALAGLFEDAGVLVAGAWAREARGGREIARSAPAIWERGPVYLADPRRVVQARDTALVVAERAISVMRRAGDGSWRYVISLLSFEDTTHEEDR
jgi:hypothetical protein